MLSAQFLLCIVFAFQTVQAKNNEGIRFVEQALDFNHTGGEGMAGAAWLDFDADGDLDLFLSNGTGAKNGLFKNNGDGSFTDIADEAGVANGQGGSGVVVGDLDNDGFPDLFVSGEGYMAGPNQSPSKLYHNNGDGSFTDISENSGVISAGSALSAAMGDINNDGLLDIFITSPGHLPMMSGPGTEESHENKLYLNKGDLTFMDISFSAGIDGLFDDPTPGANRQISHGACVVGMSDYDQDGWLDIIVGNCNGFPLDSSVRGPVRSSPFNLFKNNGDSTFSDKASTSGLGQAGFWMGLGFGDYNQDGWVDFAATSTGTLNGSLHVLMQNNGDGTFKNVAEHKLANTPFGWGVTAADFNNDGGLDIFKIGSFPMFNALGPNGSRGQVLFQGESGFFEMPDTLPIDLSSDYTTGLARADYNGDGFVDVVVVRATWPEVSHSNGQPLLLKNVGNENQWLNVRLTGTTSNRMGIGSRVEVFTGKGQPQLREIHAGGSFASSESPWPSFGMGGHNRFALIRVSWPSGLSEWFPTLELDRVYDVVEGSGIFHRQRSASPMN